MTHRLELLIGADVTELGRLRDRLRRWLTRHGQEADDWLLVANELCTNAMAVTSDPIRLRMTVGHDEVLLEISDNGPGFELEIICPVPTAARHRGLWIVNHLTSSLTVERANGRTTVIAARPVTTNLVRSG